MDKLRVGMIGVGRISDMHYQGYAGSPRAELHAICDVDGEALERRAGEWGVEKTYADYREMLADPSVDAVDVITPHYLHAPLTIAALEAGKHVSVQKPMALNIAEADAMVEAADRSGKLLRVIENYRYFEPYRRARQVIEAGDIGEPISMRVKSVSGTGGWDVPDSAQEWRSDPALAGEGSVLFDHGHHIWAVAMHLLGAVESVFAFVGQTRPTDHFEVQPGSALDSPAMISWKYPGLEMYGSCEVVHSEELVVPSSYYPIDLWFEVTGRQGVVTVNYGPNGRMLDRPAVDVYRDGIVTPYPDGDADYLTSFSSAVGDFVDAVLDGRQSALTGREAREVLRFSLAILRSGKERREVRLGEVTA